MMENVVRSFNISKNVYFITLPEIICISMCKQMTMNMSDTKCPVISSLYIVP